MTSDTTDRPRPAIRIDAQFDRPSRGYAPGDAITVRYWIGGVGQERLRAIEHSIDWYTEGKGEEDLGVHWFERILPTPDAEPSIEGVVSTTLPASPLSYEGVIVKIRWCLRVRVFFGGGRDFVSEHVFSVGDLPPARPVSTSSRRTISAEAAAGETTA